MANIWRTPIFDRTRSDVTTAIQQIAKWKNSHNHIVNVNIGYDHVGINEGKVTTTADSVIWDADGVAYVENDALVVQLGGVYDLKGCLNLSDLTRIEDNITYLAKRLKQYQYPIVFDSREWKKDDLPTALDMLRIAENIRALYRGFLPPVPIPEIPSVMLSYTDINTLEQNLNSLKEILDTMEKSFVESGAYQCGATMRLPIRR